MDSKVNGCRIGGEHSEQEIVRWESWEESRRGRTACDWRVILQERKMAKMDKSRKSLKFLSFSGHLSGGN